MEDRTKATKGIEPPKTSRFFPLALLALPLLAGGIAAAVFLLPGRGGKKEAEGKPFQTYPDLPSDSVKSQRLGQVDFSNPHTAKNAPRIVAAASRLDKLVIISRLKEAGTPEAANALVEIVTQTSPDVKEEDDPRPHAIGALIHLRNEEAWAGLRRLAGSETEFVRMRTAVSLGYADAGKAMPILEGLAKDEAESVRKAAAVAMQKLAEKKKPPSDD